MNEYVTCLKSTRTLNEKKKHTKVTRRDCGPNTFKVGPLLHLSPLRPPLLFLRKTLLVSFF